MPNYSGMWNLVQQLQASGAGVWPATPGAPTGVSASAGDARATISFTAPTYTGVPSTITGYRVTSSPGAITATGSSSPITVTGLTNGTSYTFTVAAQNATGYGSESSASNAVTPSLAVEDVFSTWLYTGTGAAQTITNGINLSGQGGLVWLKCRTRTQSHGLFDTNRGENPYLCTDLSDGQLDFSNGVVYNSNGFTNKATSFFGGSGDGSGQNYVSWTFAKAPKFFDVVTYTGNDTSRSIAHNLGVAPGCIIVKNISRSGFNWVVYHRSTGATQWLKLNLTDAVATNATYFPTDPTATTFAIGSGGQVNNGGDTFVAYLFAHVTASDGIIQCGSFNNSGGPVTVTLGWEPQWLLMKNAASSGDWYIVDNMRAMPVGGSDDYLITNSIAAENSGNIVEPTATGFTTAGLPGSTNFIYIAIRRGPMRTPTVGTSVFMPTLSSAAVGTQITTGFPADTNITRFTGSDTYNANFVDRLRGLQATNTSAGQTLLITSSTNGESTGGGASGYQFWNTGWRIGSYYNLSSTVYYSLRRAPGFYDTVCYSGTGSARTINHNLGVAPELIIVKERVYGSYDWMVQPLSDPTKMLRLNTTAAQTAAGSIYWNNTAPTASVFSVGAGGDGVNQSGGTYVAYLFASCPGVSKVGSYTGDGGSQTINCAFTTGARFIMIKRTDSTGNWFVWDTARGITVGNDPYFSMNTTGAEVTTNNSVDVTNVGFNVNQDAATNINVNGATYIFLAVA